MTNIKEVRMNVDILSNNEKIGNVDITISNNTLYIIEVIKLKDSLFIDSFIDILLEEISNIKHQFKCKKICFSLLQNSENVTKNNILEYITNQYY